MKEEGGRLQLVGDTRTFGKGRTQAVFRLSNGAELLVTTARFVTPSTGTQIDGVGLAPDVAWDSGDCVAAAAGLLRAQACGAEPRG